MTDVADFLDGIEFDGGKSKRTRTKKLKRSKRRSRRKCTPCAFIT